MRQFEYIDKEDIIKKMVTVTFGKFLNYYKHAPVIEKPVSGRRGEGSGSRGEGRASGGRRKRGAEAGYRRLFINLGKTDGFYPGEIMQFLNRNVQGRQEVGHIDLLQKFSYIEVPEQDAQKVMRALNGLEYKGREVRCNDADEGGRGRQGRGGRSEGRGGRTAERRGGRPAEGRRQRETKRSSRRKDDFEDQTDWRSLIGGQPMKLKGEEPDFSEEGWARRKPKQK